MNFYLDKRILYLLVIIVLSFFSLAWTFWIFNDKFDLIKKPKEIVPEFTHKI